MMTLDELIEHTENLDGLLKIKLHQLDRMEIGSVTRARHAVTIAALQNRVIELHNRARELRGDAPTLEIPRVRPGVPPLVDMVAETKPVGGLTAPAREI